MSGRESSGKNRRSITADAVFAGGDIVHGPDAIHAIADGHRSAKAIDEYLTKRLKEKEPNKR